MPGGEPTNLGLESTSFEMVDAVAAHCAQAQPGGAAESASGGLADTILHEAPQSLVVFDEQGVIQLFNRASERLFGYSAGEVLGKNVQILTPSGDFGTRGNEGARNWIEGGRDHGGGGSEALGRRKDNSTFPIDLTTKGVNVEGRGFYTTFVRDATSRKDLERQLNHAQKMESVGQLAAGIAHEINTPIQYVGDNLRFLKDAFESLDDVLQAYRRLEADSQENTDSPALQQVRQACNDADLEYTLEEIPKAIKQSLDGTERVAKIVRAMKEFSHPSTKEKAPVDIHDAIESAITVSRHEWKYVAEVVTDFDPEIPLVPCLQGEFNQAVLNLLVNAGHAIAEKVEDSGRGTITVSTRLDEGWVEVRIADTGNGIPEKVRDKIFDPFFTTKPVGRGTGQGLAITYSAIVEKHEGMIHFETETGVGTTFILRIPLDIRGPL